MAQRRVTFTIALAAFTAMALAAASCGGGPGSFEPPDGPAAPFESSAVALTRGSCDDSFHIVELPHRTRGPGDTSSTFDGTGAGVAVGDLDDDGDLDLVLANLSSETSILWNEGGLRFRPDPLIEGRFRQPVIVDVEGDGDADVVLSTGVGPPVLFEQRDGVFERSRLDGVAAATYSMAWGDLGGDGDLDLVTGSYNAELSIVRNSPVLGRDTGVVVHERDGDALVATRIAAEAQALAVRLVDIDGDGRSDILVGNDLATPDGAWVDNRGGWLPVERFDQTSFSTMSLDAADVDRDGDFDVLATDMAPRRDDPDADQRYAEVDEDMAAMGRVDEIQVAENTLAIGGDEGFENRARELGIEATGWSWSGIFGDLDADGLLDVHITTGMRSDQLFAALPGDELVEPNQVFRNDGERFEPMPSWNLASEVGGRGSAMADLDDDGDLDIVINNLGSPSVVHENRLCGGGSVVVELQWPSSANDDGVGARIVARHGDSTQLATIDATRGYLSGGPTRAHLGLGDDPEVELIVVWPDGAHSEVGPVAADHRITITRS